MEKTYNGWHNYETWNAKLWLDNDEGTQNLMTEYAKRAKEQFDPDDPMSTPVRVYLADIIKDLINEDKPEIPASMYSDLLQSAIDSIDYFEIADNILSDN